MSLVRKAVGEVLLVGVLVVGTSYPAGAAEAAFLSQPLPYNFSLAGLKCGNPGNPYSIQR